MIRFKFLIFALHLFIFYIPALALPTEIYVPGDYPTIQEAIDSAAPGDTITVSPGTYVENIDFLGKNIVLRSASGPSVTVIDGGDPIDPDYGSVASFQNNEGPDCILRGFTLTKGTGTRFPPAMGSGGGIFCHNCTPTIEGNIIRNNETRYGIGIFCYNASPLIINNEITQNSSGLQGTYGAGIYCTEDSSPFIQGNTIFKNRIATYGSGGGVYIDTDCFPTIIQNTLDANLAYYGGAIYCNGGGSALIAENLIMNNRTLDKSNSKGGGIVLTGDLGSVVVNNVICNNSSAGRGGGISCQAGNSSYLLCNRLVGNSAEAGGGLNIEHYSDVMVANNVFLANTSTKHGGGVYIMAAEPHNIYNNTFVGNATSGTGSALCVSDESEVKITNCIFWENELTSSSVISIIDRYYGPAMLKLQYCDLQGSEPSVEIHPGSRLVWGSGMVDAPPAFVDADQEDFHLTFASPCKDAGLFMTGMPCMDYDDNPRTAFGAVDIGADEFYTHLYYTGQIAPNELIDIKLIGIPGYVTFLWSSLSLLDPPALTPYGPWYLDFPLLFSANLGIMNTEGVIVIPARIPGNASPPWSLYLQALANERLTGPCTIILEE